MERKTVILTDVQTKGDGPGSFSGYGSVFGVLDHQGDIVTPGAFANTLERFKRDGLILFGHDWGAAPVATPRDAYEDSRGLYLTADFHSTPAAQEVRTIVAERVARGKRMGLSIGYQVRPGGYEQTTAGRLLKDLDLFEVSVVPVPANAEAQVVAAKAVATADPLRAELLALRARFLRAYRPGPAMSREELIALRNRHFSRMVEARYGRGGRR